MSMRVVDTTDPRGLQVRIELPDEADDDEVALGVRVGPPELSPLGLPPGLEVRLNNELWRRGILTRQDALKKSGELVAAWQTALKVDAQELMKLYLGENGYH